MEQMSNATLLYGHLADKELVKKVRGGQKTAFEVLVRRHSKALYRVGRMYGFSHSEAEELIICTHLEAYSPQNKFIGSFSYRAWLTKLMIGNCLKTDKQLTTQNNDIGAEPACSPARSAQHYESKRFSLNSEMSGKVEACIEQLPLSLRSIYILSEIDGYSPAETAHLLNIPESSVKDELSKAKTSIRKSLMRLYQITDVYPFDNQSCERVVHYVMSKIDAKAEVPLGVPAI